MMDEIFDLPFQLMVVICVMTVVSVEMAVILLWEVKNLNGFGLRRYCSPLISIKILDQGQGEGYSCLIC